MFKRLAGALACALALILLTCDEGVNPYDPTRDSYVSPSFDIEPSLSTIAPNAVTAESAFSLTLKGNLPDNLFRWQLNDAPMSPWSASQNGRFVINAPFK
jgi:hypothetical protein